MDDNQESGRGNVPTEIRIDLQKVIDSVHFHQISLSSLLDYLTWTAGPFTQEQQLSITVRGIK